MERPISEPFKRIPSYIKRQLLFTASRAVPSTLFTPPQSPSLSLKVNIKSTLEPPTLLQCHSMHRVIAQLRDEPLRRLLGGDYRRHSVTESRRGGLFKRLAFPRRTRATWLLNSCIWHFQRPNVDIALAFCLLRSVRCAVVIGPTITMYSVVALWHDLCGLLRRLLHTLYGLPVPGNVTLWSAPFLPNLYTYSAASFVV